MASLTDIRAGVAANINTYCEGLPAVKDPPGTINVPCAIVLPDQGTSIDWQVTMSSPVPSEANFSVRAVIIVSTGADPAATTLLDSFLASAGPSSVRAAIEADPTLGGVAEFAVAARVQRYGMIEWGGITYLSAEVIVEAGAN